MDFWHPLRAEERREPTFFRAMSKMIFLETQKFNHQIHAAGSWNTRYAQKTILHIAPLKGLQTAVGNKIIVLSTFQLF